MNSSEASSLLRKLVEQCENLGFRDEAGLDGLTRRVEMIVRRIFGAESKYLSDLTDIHFYPRAAPASPEYVSKQWNSGKNSLKNLLSTALEEVDLLEAAPESSPSDGKTAAGRKVFVVHGHDEALKQLVARVLETLDLQPIILHEQPNRGRTIIEKFEDYSDVAFAVVLLTPDDIGYESQEGVEKARPRARQNVVLELGFFLGKLGRAHVAALYKPAQGKSTPMELPTDYDGVLFLPIDKAGKWKFNLAQELQECGIDADANKLLGS